MRAPRPTLAVAVVLILAAALPAAAIVRRHDRDDAAHRALAEPPHPVGVVGGLAHGTLIAPRWVLTAAHVARGISPFRHHVRFGADEVPYDSVRYHPAAQRRDGWVDMALLRLARPIRGVAPAAPYDRADELGQVVLFLGTGRTGDGRTGPTTGDRVWRGARNRITEVTPEVVRFVFDPPPAGDSLEGISGPGDSGGPALIERDGRLWVAGVSSTNTSPHNEALCTYGTVETYARVSTQRAWIDSVLEDRATSPGSEWTHPTNLAEADWPASAMAARARAWLEAVSANDPDRLEAWAEAHADSAWLARRGPAQRRAWYEEVWNTWGIHTPVAVSERRDGTIAVLVAAANDGLWLDYRFAPSASEPGRVGMIGSIDLNAKGTSFAWPLR